MRALAPQLVTDIGVFRAADLKRSPENGSWQLDSLVGILAEISEELASGAVSFAAEIMADAQDHGHPVAWVAGGDSVFFPPDLAERGIDLSAVAVIRVSGETDTLTAAEWLVRSGSFGLVLVDTEPGWKVSDAALGRLQKLAEHGQTAVVFLTRKRGNDPSLGSRISLRGCITRTGAAPFQVHVHTVKDKRSGMSSRQTRQYDGPAGLH
jgi:recombination protein RecA